VGSRLFIRGYRAAFLFVGGLLVAVAGFNLWGEMRTNARVDALFSQARERDALIGRIRVDALNLEGAVDAHIRALGDEERRVADVEMEEILADIADASQAYTRDLPPGELEVWNRFNDTCRALAQQVRTAVKYSNRKQAELARQHLTEQIKPVTWNLETLADELSAKNGEESRRLLRSLELLRFRTTFLGVVVAVAAVALALFVGLQVTKLLRRQESTIQAQLLELDRRNRELDSFASRVAHDLISPLAPLKGYLTLVRRSASITRDPDVVEMLKSAELSAQRMSEMIEALLRFCRAGNRSEAVSSELDTAVSTILTEAAQHAAQVGVGLERDLEPGLFVPCPSQLLQSIAENLLSNAIKYSAGWPQAKVVVRVRREQKEALLEVEDNGRGMSEASQHALFQPFFRAPEATGLPGHGLGLATTKRLVEGHGGSIQVRSELNRGTRVSVRFPLVPPPPVRMASPPRSTPDDATSAMAEAG
jgi:signal transduction histidine kinase